MANKLALWFLWGGVVVVTTSTVMFITHLIPASIGILVTIIAGLCVILSTEISKFILKLLKR